MTYYTRKAAIIKIREAIREAEGRDYAISYISQIIKKQSGKWIVKTARGNIYELDA